MASALAWGRGSHNFFKLLGDPMDAGERLGALLQVLVASADVDLTRGDGGLPDLLPVIPVAG